MSAMQDAINIMRATALSALERTSLMTYEDQQLRERMLELALRQQLGDPVTEAARHFDFVKGQSPREQINAALDQAGVK